MPQIVAREKIIEALHPFGIDGAVDTSIMLKQISESDRVSIYSLGYYTHLPVSLKEVAFCRRIFSQHETRARC
jgi:hypothetical protein